MEIEYNNSTNFGKFGDTLQFSTFGANALQDAIGKKWWTFFLSKIVKCPTSVQQVSTKKWELMRFIPKKWGLKKWTEILKPLIYSSYILYIY